MCKSKIEGNVLELNKWIDKEKYRGYDPYDALNSNSLKTLKSKWARIFFTQFLKYSPINFRSFFGISKGINPKGLGLILKSKIKLYELGIIKDKSEIEELADLLLSLSSKDYSGHCWGYDFDWQSKTRYLKSFVPTIVNTSFISNALIDLYEISNDKRYLEISRSSCDFIIKDLNIMKFKSGICFSYTPIDKEVVHNANVLGAALLARVYSFTKEEKLLYYSKRAFDFTLNYQTSQGMWHYSIDLQKGTMNKLTDWHQGFILDSIFSYIKYVQPSDKKYLNSLIEGAEFYKNQQFLKDGRCCWRWPQVWPIDIHNQAQGIITFSKLSAIKSSYLKFAQTIAKWTIDNMQDEIGCFYHQKWPFFTNKIIYMRWSQAWMLFALSTLVYRGEVHEEHNISN